MKYKHGFDQKMTHQCKGLTYFFLVSFAFGVQVPQSLQEPLSQPLSQSLPQSLSQPPPWAFLVLILLRQRVGVGQCQRQWRRERAQP